MLSMQLCTVGLPAIYITGYTSVARALKHVYVTFGLYMSSFTRFTESSSRILDRGTSHKKYIQALYTGARMYGYNIRRGAHRVRHVGVAYARPNIIFIRCKPLIIYVDQCSAQGQVWIYIECMY